MANEWYAARKKVLTPRDHDHDLGMALVEIGATLAALFGVNRVWGFASIGRITSPKTKLRFLIWAAVTWLSFGPSLEGDDEMRYQRGEFPVWAEPSPTANALVMLASLATLPVVLLGVQVAVWKTPLPVKLVSGRPMRNTFVELPILLAMLLDIYVIYIGLTEEISITSSAVVAMYLLLCGRAAANHPEWSGRVSAARHAISSSAVAMPPSH
jgi:hypothetical protein